MAQGLASLIRDAVDAAATPGVAGASAAEPASVEPAPVEPAPVEPAPVATAPVEPAPVATAPVESASVAPTAVEPTAVEPAPVATASVAPAPVAPASRPVWFGAACRSFCQLWARASSGLSPLVHPVRPAVPATRWTLKRLVAWVEQQFGCRVGRETLRRVLKGMGFSWKKGKKLLNRADPEQRQAFVERIAVLLKAASTSDEQLLVYIDEAHIHQDSDTGYGWSERGRRLWISSSSPGLKAKVSFYGLYLYNEAQVRIWDYERANGEHTCDVLRRLRREFPERSIQVIWDGVSYHRSHAVQALAASLDIELIRLPAYSPDFMPVEALWRWLREDVTYHRCHPTRDDLLAHVAAFAQRINQAPYELADRLWVKDTLHLEEEKLRAVPLGPRASAALGLAA